MTEPRNTQPPAFSQASQPALPESASAADVCPVSVVDPAASVVDPAAAKLIAELTAAGHSLATAESLTGGLLAATLVSVPGASSVFAGGIIAYDTRLKEQLLGVSGELLAAEGPVAEQVALQMASGVRMRCAVTDTPCDVGVATTGVAGPDPDPQTGQPPGTVWIAVDYRGQREAKRLRLSGDRLRIRQETVAAALQLISAQYSADPQL